MRHFVARVALARERRRRIRRAGGDVGLHLDDNAVGAVWALELGRAKAGEAGGLREAAAAGGSAEGRSEQEHGVLAN